MRGVKKEAILLLLINALHTHCRTVLRTQNISETDSLFSLKEYERSACICKNGNCVNEGGKEICKCNPGYGNFIGTSCVACKCGPDISCMWPSGRRSEKICLCKPGYSQQYNTCRACNCGPDSNCTFSGWSLQKKCICKPGYLDVDGKCVETPCNSSPCQNGGKCTVSGKSFTCECEEPYSGKTCETSPCTSDPCKNNGACEVEGKGFKCNCNIPWGGKTCENGPCDKQPCQNGGTCKVDKTGFICKCLTPFNGPRCENGPCTSNPCQNNGTCEVSEDSYRCSCNKLFKGTNCEIECNCGPYGSCSFEYDRKRCNCKSFAVEKNGVCVVMESTTLEGSTATMTTVLPSTTQYCSCGENSKSCRYNVLGEKECNCSSGYAQTGGYCEECNCGPYGSCSLEYDRKRCNCKSFAIEKNGECVVMESTTLEGTTATMTTVLPSTTQYCSCGENSKSCRYNVLGEKECNCSSGYAQTGGYCEECNCGPFGSCSLEYDRKRCNCKSFAIEKNGVCVVMESTTLEGSTATITTVLPSTTQYCDCGEYSNFCRKNWKGVKICDCFPGYVEKNGTCEDKRTSLEGTTDSITSTIGSTSTIGPTSTIGSSTVQDCDCGEYSNFCRKNWKGVKICDCFPGYVENHGTCEDAKKDLLANDVKRKFKLNQVKKISGWF